ncbi:MAG: glycosyltransferase family 39 protein [Deltaproteobacteria bacterium]|nr:glycosyltransferase family 39 protein [Deltaproteobacteria bacterium]
MTSEPEEPMPGTEDAPTTEPGTQQAVAQGARSDETVGVEAPSEQLVADSASPAEADDDARSAEAVDDQASESNVEAPAVGEVPPSGPIGHDAHGAEPTSAAVPPRRRRRAPAVMLLGVALALVTIAMLARGHRDVGYARDEGIYFDASRSYAAWVAAIAEQPGRIGDRKLRDKHFSNNHEHPVLMKTLAGLSARWLAAPPIDPQRPPPQTGPPGGMLEGAAMRLPAQIFAGLGVLLLFMVGARWAGVTGGLLAAGWFILLPRVAFHAGLHAFDVPIAVATLAVALVYRASLRDRRWGWGLGPLLGIAIAVKHNALFIGPLLALHYYACLAWGRWRHARPISRGQWLPLPLLGMAIVAPLVAWALWPWMWSDTVARLTEYVDFHRQHSWYNMEFLGLNHNQPPMPIAYPAVMTWATVPTGLLVLAIAGLGLSARADSRRAAAPTTAPARWSAPLPMGWERLDSLWLGLFGLFPLVLISLPSTPIFGGTKHWLTAYPFLALAAVVAWRQLWKAAAVGRRERWLGPIALAVCLGPAAMATANGHPYNLSQYAPLAGGPRGAADLGLNRGFWGHAVYGFTPTLEQLPGPIHLHDMHELARRQYAREGRWPPGLAPAGIRRARSGLMFHELHMTSDELKTWAQLGTTAPHQVISLDDVPLSSLYVEP